MIAGIETGGTKVVVAAAHPDRPEDLVGLQHFPTTTPSETLARIVDFLQDIDRAEPVTGVGLAAFGPVNVEPTSPRYGHVTGTSKPGWSHTDILAPLQRAVSAPVHIATDVSGAALGEARWGAAQGVDRVAYATIGTGVGIGVLLHGGIIGGNGYPEVAHITVRRHPDDDFAGTCPFHGDCLEGLAAGPAITARFGAPGVTLTGEEQAKAADFAGYYIAQMLIGATHTLGLQRILVGGGVSHTPTFMARLREHFSILSGRPGAGDGTHANPAQLIIPPGLGAESGVRGAIALGLLATAP